MSNNPDINFLENDKIFLDLNKDTLELKCSLDIDGSIYSGNNDIINAINPIDFNYYYSLSIQTKNGDRKIINNEFVELKETPTSGVYSFDIKDFKKNVYDIIQNFITDKLARTEGVQTINLVQTQRTTATVSSNRKDLATPVSMETTLPEYFDSIINSFEGLDIIDVSLAVFYIDKNTPLPPSFNVTAPPNNSIKLEKFIIPSMSKENVFYVSESNIFPYKYEITWDKIKLFKEFLVTIYCGDEKLLTFKTTETKIDLFNFKVHDKTYNLKDLLGPRTDASNFKLEIKMIDSTIDDIDESYTFEYSQHECTKSPKIIRDPSWCAIETLGITALTPAIDYPIASMNSGAPNAPIDMNDALVDKLSYITSVFLKYRKFFPNQTYTFTFEIDWSKYTNSKITHIHNKVERSDSTLVFNITAQEYPFKVLYLFGNVDIIVILRDILAFAFTFPWDLLKDVGFTIREFLCSLNIDFNLNIGNTLNKIIDIIPELAQLFTGEGESMIGYISDLYKGRKASGKNDTDPCTSSSAWKDILHDCMDSCKKLPTSDHSSKPCSNSSETNTSCKERNCNLRNTLILLQEKIIQFNNLLPRVMVGTYVFNNKEDKLGFHNLNNGTPYGLATLSYSYILKAISGNKDDEILNERVKKFLSNKKDLLLSQSAQIDNKIADYKLLINSTNSVIISNNQTYKTKYSEYIGAINVGDNAVKEAKLIELTTLTTRNKALEAEISKIKLLISSLEKQALDINLTLNDINKTSTIDLVNYNSVNTQFSIDSPSANEKSYIIKFIDTKNVDTLNIKGDNQECKPHSSNNLLHTFVNKF